MGPHWRESTMSNIHRVRRDGQSWSGAWRVWLGRVLASPVVWLAGGLGRARVPARDRYRMCIGLAVAPTAARQQRTSQTR